LLKGKLGSLDQICVIRGGDLHEISDSKFGSPGWNSGFLTHCAYGVLTSPPLKDNSALDSERIILKNMASRWRLTMYFDARIPVDIRKDTFRHIKLPVNVSSVLQSIIGIRLLLGEIFKIRGWKYRFDSRRSTFQLRDFLQALHDCI
jgi:hypothetical protein